MYVSLVSVSRGSNSFLWGLYCFFFFFPLTKVYPQRSFFIFKKEAQGNFLNIKTRNFLFLSCAYVWYDMNFKGYIILLPWGLLVFNITDKLRCWKWWVFLWVFLEFLLYFWQFEIQWNMSSYATLSSQQVFLKWRFVFSLNFGKSSNTFLLISFIYFQCLFILEVIFFFMDCLYIFDLIPFQSLSLWPKIFFPIL